MTKKRKYFFVAAGIISFVAISFLLSIGWSLTHEKPPRFFPFNDPDATYTITKRDNKYLIKYESTGDMNAHQICNRVGGELTCHTEINREIEVMIGRSETQLEQFVGKSVIVDGDFVYADEQCIAQECQHIGGWAVLNIESISASNE